MNAAGLTFILSVMSGDLGMPFYKSLVTDGSISQGEFDGTRSNLAAVVETLKKTPPDKIEAMVAEYNDLLTEHEEKYNAVRGQLDGFRHAQAMAGYVTTILAKSGLRE